MTDRTALKQELDAIRAIERRLDAIMRPYNELAREIASAREAVLERHEVDVAGSCEGCSAVICVGDQHYAYDDGPMFCEACAPTFADIQRMAEAEPEAYDMDPAAIATVKDRIGKHVAAGGSLDDRYTWEA